jgi:hypothetical protein
MTAILDTGPPPGSRPSGPVAGTGRCAVNQRGLRRESNRSPRVAQRCHATLHRVGNVAFAGQLHLEDDAPCRIKVVWGNQQLKFDLCFLDRLSWASTILWPANNPDFAGQLFWENRRYLVGVHVLHKPELCLETFLRPLHLSKPPNAA